MTFWEIVVLVILLVGIVVYSRLTYRSIRAGFDFNTIVFFLFTLVLLGLAVNWKGDLVKMIFKF